MASQTPLKKKEEVAEAARMWWDKRGFTESFRGIGLTHFVAYIEKSMGKEGKARKLADLDIIILFMRADNPSFSGGYSDILKYFSGTFWDCDLYPYVRGDLNGLWDHSEGTLRDILDVRVMEIKTEVGKRWNGVKYINSSALYARYIMEHNGFLIAESPAGYSSQALSRIVEVTCPFQHDYEGTVKFERSIDPATKERRMIFR